MITIQLTDRAPVEIDKAEWPIVAEGTGDSYVWGDYARHEQALAQGEPDTYRLRVRRHADGRALVTGYITAGHSHPDGENRRGGEIVQPGKNVVAAILCVAEDLDIPLRVARECIADLPATPLV